MKKENNNLNSSEDKSLNLRETNTEGYPIYPEREDIYAKLEVVNNNIRML